MMASLSVHFKNFANYPSAAITSCIILSFACMHESCAIDKVYARKSSADLINTVYALISDGELLKAADLVRGTSSSDAVVRLWLDLQHSIFELKEDARAAALFGELGARYAEENGYLRSAALFYHNICSFLMPDFDEEIQPQDLDLVLKAARLQVELRRKINHRSRLVWALWDLGIAKLAGGNHQAAIAALVEGEQLALKDGDKKAAAWCRIFIGKAKIKYRPEKQFEGEREMLQAAKTIREGSGDWEKESVRKILKSVWLD